MATASAAAVSTRPAAPPPCKPIYGGTPARTTARPNLTDVNDNYDKEVSKAAEIGFKSYFLERTLSVNAALFHTDVEDMQFFNFFAGPFGLLRVVTNLDEVTIQGGEIDARWKRNDNFTIFGGYGFTDGNIDKYAGRPYTKDNEVPYAPEYTGNLGAEARFPMGEALSASSRASMRRSSARPGSIRSRSERLPNLFTGFGFGQGEFSKQKRDPYARINLRLTPAG